MAAAFFVRFQHQSKKQDKFSVFPLAFLTICCTIETAAYILPLYFWKGRFLMLTQEHLQDALDYGRCFIKFGKPASYIPELARVNKYHLGVCVVGLDGSIMECGDSRVPFTIQSISKLASLILAISDQGRGLPLPRQGGSGADRRPRSTRSSSWRPKQNPSTPSSTRGQSQ